jgi:hypothetical protein
MVGTGTLRQPLSAIVLVVRLAAHRLAWNGVAAPEPAAKIDIGTALAAEGTVVRYGRLAAERAFGRRFGRLDAQGLGALAWQAARSQFHSVSISALFSQK